MKIISASILLFLVFSLARAAGLSPLPPIGYPPSEGIASWYGSAHEGRKTASGAVFRRHALTAAHRTAVFGTRYLVFYQGQVVEVLVNDRGPYTKRRGHYARDLDLSEAAARSLGLTEAGVARVSLRPVEYPLQEVNTDQLLPMVPSSLLSFD